jgi:hypothetical protein
VRDPDGLEVKVGDHGIDLAKLGTDTLLNWTSGRRLVGGGGDMLHLGDMEEVLCFDDPASKGISCGALTLPSEGSHANPLMSGSGLGLGGRKCHNKGGVSIRDAGRS